MPVDVTVFLPGADLSMDDIDVGAVFVKLPILTAVKTNFAGQIKPVIAVVALTKHPRSIPARTAEEEVTRAVGPELADRQRAAGAAAPANVIE